MYVYRNTNTRKILDIEIGYLAKSPCRGCLERHHRFPACTHTCEILDRIQTALSKTVSSTRSYSELESFIVNLEG